MSEFTITETDRPGIEKAAQWHEQQADAIRETMKGHGRETMQYELLWIASDTHRDAARSLRLLARPKSSAPESGFDGPVTRFWYKDSEVIGGGQDGGSNK